MLIFSRREINISNKVGCTLLAQSAQFEKGIRGICSTFLETTRQGRNMPEAHFKVDGFCCSLFPGFGRQANKRRGWQCCSRAAGFYRTADGDWEGCPDSELPPLRIPEPWMALARGIPSGRVPPRRPKLLAHPATSRPHLGLILLGPEFPAQSSERFLGSGKNLSTSICMYGQGL